MNVETARNTSAHPIRDGRLYAFVDECKVVARAVKFAKLRALEVSAVKTAASRSETEMLSIHGTAMQRTLRDLNRAAVGCPSIMGSWSWQVAKHYRGFEIELDR